jgi:hypothetical protein
LHATFPLPFRPARTIEGTGRGGTGTFLVAAMFTRGYADFAGRLQASCEAFGLPYQLHEVASVHTSISAKGSPDAEFTKPNYIRNLLALHRKPILYVDADCEFRAYPALIDELLAAGTSFAVYNWLADPDNDTFYPVDVRVGGVVIQDRYFVHSHRVSAYAPDQLTCSGCTQLYDTSAAAAALLARWHETIVAHPQAPDDQCLGHAFNNGGSALPGLRRSWLPKAYARYCWWIFARPVIDHPQFPALGGNWKMIPDEGPVRPVYLEGCAHRPSRFPKGAVVDVQARLLYQHAGGKLTRIGALHDECWIAPGNRTSAAIEVSVIE